jgi:hypothetical protein
LKERDAAILPTTTAAKRAGDVKFTLPRICTGNRKCIKDTEKRQGRVIESAS